jgi:hypothetical protein
MDVSQHGHHFSIETRGFGGFSILRHQKNGVFYIKDGEFAQSQNFETKNHGGRLVCASS